MKNARQAKILELIEHNSIDRQEELLARLREVGYNVTQATVSRDIRELHLVKAATGDGRYRYVASFQREKLHHAPSRFETIFREAVVKIDHAGNIVLVKCFTGMANAACELFDSMVWNEVVGTLSGDDTFIVITRDEASATALHDQLMPYTTKRQG
ncbi:arginine repressor [Ruminococcaceae bacterium OttesenSCG-928-O06]|nr:arginine repressor [Ruminococcaceae bacterium OttesenSCG-928-O06]